MFYISSIWASNQTFILVISDSNTTIIACIDGRVFGYVLAILCLNSVNVNAWARIVDVISKVFNNIIVVFMAFLLVKLFYFCFYILVFKIIELGCSTAIFQE